MIRKFKCYKCGKEVTEYISHIDLTVICYKCAYHFQAKCIFLVIMFNGLTLILMFLFLFFK